MIQIIINDIPPSNNQSQGKSSWYAFQNAKKQWAKKIETALKGKIPEKPIDKSIVHLHYIFGDKRRRDPDNYSGKLLLDPLVRLGVIADDSFFHIKLEISGDFTTRKEKRTVITITEVESLEEDRIER